MHGLPPDGETLVLGQARRLRLLRLPLPVLLGVPAVPDHRGRRDADDLGAGQPQTRRTGGRAGSVGTRYHLIRAGQVVLGDKGFAGRDFEAFLRDRLRAHLVRPDRKDEPSRFGRLARYRRWIEAIIDTLKGQLTLED